LRLARRLQGLSISCTSQICPNSQLWRQGFTSRQVCRWQRDASLALLQACHVCVLRSPPLRVSVGCQPPPPPFVLSALEQPIRCLPQKGTGGLLPPKGMPGTSKRAVWTGLCEGAQAMHRGTVSQKCHPRYPPPPQKAWGSCVSLRSAARQPTVCPPDCLYVCCHKAVSGHREASFECAVCCGRGRETDAPVPEFFPPQNLRPVFPPTTLLLVCVWGGGGPRRSRCEARK
jgi:hypothetical protein